jgi:Cu/Ag efflux pump CusA
MPASRGAISAVSRQTINKVANELQKELKSGNTIQVVGQIQSMNDSFRDLGIGLLFASVLVYLLMVVNYQTFGDPFVVILALPATEGHKRILFCVGRAEVPDFARVHVVGRLRCGPARRAFAGIMGLATRQHISRVVEVHDLLQAGEISIMPARLHKGWRGPLVHVAQLTIRDRQFVTDVFARPEHPLAVFSGELQ